MKQLHRVRFDCKGCSLKCIASDCECICHQEHISAEEVKMVLYTCLGSIRTNTIKKNKWLEKYLFEKLKELE
jgi:hypothetical protein